MNVADLNNLDFSDLGSWPGPAKMITAAIVCVAILGSAYWFDTQHQLNDLDQAERQEADLKLQFETKQHKAANLEKYRQQMKEMEDNFGTLLRQLPGKTEVAGLLEDISQTGLAAGLEFQLFKPESEIRREFYSELPINMKVTGTYHEFGTFVSDIAALPRIVTVHDFAMTPVGVARGKNGGKDQGPPLLSMQVTAKTYRYIEEGGQ